MRANGPSTSKKQSAAWGLGIALIATVAAGAWFFALRSKGTQNGSSAVPAASHELREPQLRAAIRAASDDPRHRLALIQELAAAGRHHDALDAAREANEAIPGRSELQLALAGALDGVGMPEEAIALLHAEKQEGPSFRLREAAFLVRSGRVDEAITILRKLPRVSADLAMLAGQIYLDARQPEAAAPLFKQAADGASEAGTDHGAALTHYGFALLASGEYRRAAEALEQALHHSPDDPLLNYYVGAAIRLSNDRARLPEAEEHLRKAVDAMPRDGFFRYEFALARVQLRDMQGARSALLEAAQLQPELAEVQRDLARVHERSTEPAEAALAQSRYLRLLDDASAAARPLEPLYTADRSDVKIGLALSEALYEAGSFTRAAKLLDELQKESKDLQILWHRLRLQSALGDYQAALKTVDALEAARAEEPALSEARATVLQHLSQHADAEKLLTKLRDGDPENAERQLRLGQALNQWSQRPDAKSAAEECFRKAVKLRPLDPEAHYELANVLLATNRPKDAVEELRHALDAAPRYRNALRALGRAYAKLGDQKQSAEAFALLKRFQAREDERARLEIPIRQLRNLHASRTALVQFHLRAGDLMSASRELEMLTRQFPDDPAPHRLLAGLYGHDRRFQRQFEELDWLRQHGGAGR